MKIPLKQVSEYEDYDAKASGKNLHSELSVLCLCVPSSWRCLHAVVYNKKDEVIISSMYSQFFWFCLMQMCIVSPSVCNLLFQRDSSQSSLVVYGTICMKFFKRWNALNSKTVKWSVVCHFLNQADPLSTKPITHTLKKKKMKTGLWKHVTEQAELI